MQRALPILGLFAILFVGMISPAMADDDKWDDKYREIEKEFEEKKHQIEEEFHDDFEEIDRQYDDAKMEIYEKIDANPDLSQSEIDRMFDELFYEFDEKRQNIESQMWEQIEEIEREFHKQLEEIDSEAREYYDKQERHYDDDDYYDDDHYDGKNYDDEYHDEYKDYAPHEKDPEWDSIEPLAKRIMEIIPMEKIQRLWEAGQLDEIVELIVSETDLTYEEAKRVVMFFEKYENQKYDDHYYPEHDYPVTDAAGYPAPGTVDNGEILRLEQRISELEDENQMLRETVAELEERLIQLNNVVMEQVKFIYEWVLSQ